MENHKKLSPDTVERMTRFRELHREKAQELIDLTGVDGLITLAYDEKTGIHIFPTDNISLEVAQEMLSQTADAITGQSFPEKDERQLELGL